jgi:hypothetical protein
MRSTEPRRSAATGWSLEVVERASGDAPRYFVRVLTAFAALAVIAAIVTGDRPAAAQGTAETPRLRDQIRDGLAGSFALPWHQLL